MLNDAILAIRKFVDALAEAEIPYYIGGSIASIVYGKARTTRDVDFVLNVRNEDVSLLVQRLESRFFFDLVAVRRAVAEGDCFNALDLETIFQADVFTPLSSPWIDAQFARRQRHRLGGMNDGIDVYLGSPEDVVLNKLYWFRLGNEASTLQWGDAIGILEVQGSRLDINYLDEWADRLELTQVLSRAVLAAGR